MRSRGVSIVASTNWMFNFIIGLTTRDMIQSMKFGTYIFFAFFSGAGGVFVWLLCPETKNKTLEELDLFFGGSMESVAQADRERMHRINERLGITGAEHPGDRAGCTASVGQEKESAATAESAEHELKA